MKVSSKYDLIQAISGADEFGESKCVISVKHQRCTADGVLREQDDEFITEKPIVQVFKQSGGYVTVDLIFHSIEDRDLKIIYSYLDRFFSSINSISDDEQEFPLLTFTFVPHAFHGVYWAIGLNPLFYTLTPEDSTGEPRIIRMTFISQDDTEELPNFLFLESPKNVMEKINIQVEDESEDPHEYRYQ